MSRRVVVLSPGGAFTSALLALLAERGSAADALLLYDPGAAGGRRLLLPARWLSRQVRRRLAPRPVGGASRVVFTGALNGAQMTADLRRLRPDVVVLAHSGLVKAPVLELASEGVVNVHPGLLPWIRGSSPLANSLLRRVPLGCTAFRVDAGIDTGRIVARRLVRVRGDETAAELRDALFRLWVEMTADLVGAARAGALPPGFAQAGRFPLCRTLPPSERRMAVEEALRAGEPAALFERWRPLCDPADLSLPAGADGPFAPCAG